MSKIARKHGSRKERVVAALIGAISLVAVLAITNWESQVRVSPGELHLSHKNVARLDGPSGCAVCHGGWGRSMDRSCLECHREIRRQMKDHQGIHGRLDASKGMGCKNCHPEHTAGAVALVTDKSFTLAGLEEPERFDHAQVTEFALAGAHAKRPCAACHVSAGAKSLNWGEQRYLGLAQACEKCHKDTHTGGFGADCASCHGQEKPFKEVATFKHTDAFRLEGSHAVRSTKSPTNDDVVKCVTCHEENGDHSVKALLAAKGKPVRSCSECHTSPHRPKFIAGIAALSKQPEGNTCALCHDVQRQTFLGPDADMSVEQHAATGYSIGAPHEKQKCVDCHSTYGKRDKLTSTPELKTQFAALFPGRNPKECQQCHKDPHKGEFASGFSKGECIRCHDETRFKPARMDPDAHNQTHFPLTGSHRTTACNKCHDSKAGLARYIPTPTDCVACHKDEHHGKFDEAGRAKNVDGRSGCARCHDTSTFKSVKWGPAEHLSWTGYALEGGHVKPACADCHKPGAGAVKAHGATSRDCASCHADAHHGVFDRPGVPKELNGNRDCARCHNTTTFSEIRWTPEDHLQWSGNSLDGGHLRLECAKCHKPGSSTGVAHRTFGLASGGCVACHPDPHAGQFAAEGGATCEKCHESTEKFQEVRFNHQRDSRFSTEKYHSQTQCPACHKTFQGDDGKPVARYKPLGMNCQDCHSFAGPPDAGVK